MACPRPVGRRDDVRTAMPSSSPNGTRMSIDAPPAVNDGNVAALDALRARHRGSQSDPESGRRYRRLQAMGAIRIRLDLHGTIENMVAEDRLLAGHVIWRGSHRGPFVGVPPTNMHVVLPAFHIVRFSAGRIVEWWGNGRPVRCLAPDGRAYQPSAEVTAILALQGGSQPRQRALWLSSRQRTLLRRPRIRRQGQQDEAAAGVVPPEV